MNKTVLFLINGLGIEHKDSYSIYSSSVMPTFDSLTKEAFFTPLTSPAHNLEEAYKYFSIGTISPLTAPYINNILENNLFNDNQKFNEFHQEVFNSQGNIHLFCFLNDEKLHDSIKKFIQIIDPNSQKTVYLHFVLPQTDISEYSNISKLFARYQYDLPSNVKRGLVVGLNILEDQDKTPELNEFVRILYKGVGEKWPDVDTKLNSLYNLRTAPNNTRAFYINDGFTISDKDIFFFYNYEHYDCGRLIQTIKNPPLYLNVDNKSENVKYYSLFQLKDKEDVKYLYEDVTSDISVAKAMEQVGLTALTLIDKENINMVNFMFNGLSNSSNSHIKYILSDNGILYLNSQMNVILNDPTYQLIIINHRIDNINDEETIKNTLNKIDKNLAMIKSLCKDKYTLIVSSLFGMKKEINTITGNKAVVDFSGRVPAILIDSKYDSKKYRLASSDTYSLLTTSLKCIKPELKVSSILKKKSLLENILFKKK